jgi:sialate O-acetylesterase
MSSNHKHTYKQFIDRRRLICATLGVISPFVAASSMAEVRLPHVLADHMVLQRGRPVHVWGMADPGKQVRVSFRGHQAIGTADTLRTYSTLMKFRHFVDA